MFLQYMPGQTGLVGKVPWRCWYCSQVTTMILEVKLYICPFQKHVTMRSTSPVTILPAWPWCSEELRLSSWSLSLRSHFSSSARVWSVIIFIFYIFFSTMPHQHYQVKTKVQVLQNKLGGVALSHWKQPLPLLVPPHFRNAPQIL